MTTTSSSASSPAFTLEEAGPAYARWLARTGHADSTKSLYADRTQRFLAWVAEQEAIQPGEYDGVLVDQHVRDYAVRDYRRQLLTVDKAAIATIEVALSAIGSFYDWLGLGKPNVKRTRPPKTAPKSLEGDQLRRVMRAAERRGARDNAIAAVLFLSAVRVSECAALDVDDVFVSDRSGLLEVRHGKGGQPRQAPLPADARAALRPWLALRAERAERHAGPLFLARDGSRLSVRRIKSLTADIGADAGVDLSPHVLRHTFARRFLDSGGDLPALQEILGHNSLASTQVYTRPPAGRVAELAENVTIDL